MPSSFHWSIHSHNSTASEEEYVAPTEELIYLEVRPVVFAAVWWVMVAIHFTCATLLTGQSRLYVYLAGPYMTYYTNLVQPGIGAKYRAVATMFGIIAVMHWTVVLLLVYYSISQRKYAFYSANHYEHTHGTKPLKPTKPTKPLTRWQRGKAKLMACRLAVFGRRGIFGVESAYFFLYFYTRETIELSSQIYQAYRGSLLVGRPWINHLSIGIIVIDCGVTPAFQLAYKRRPEVRRIAMLSLDAVLDFMTAIVVPVCIFYPYYLQFDAASHSFPLDKVYNEKWFINAVLENQEFLLISVTDLVFKSIPHISITGCLKKVGALLRKDASVVRTGHGAQEVAIFSSVVAHCVRREQQREKLKRIKERQEFKKELAAIASGQPRATRVSMHPPIRVATNTAGRYIRKYANKLIRVVFFTIAGAILTIHMQPHTNPRPSRVSRSCVHGLHQHLPARSSRSTAGGRTSPVR